jgi:DNA-directed RNA polymerase subunit RPC12/RpoP
VAELYKSKAPESDLYFSAQDVRDRLKTAIQVLNSLTKVKTKEEGEDHRRRIHSLLLNCDRILEYSMNKMGKPVRCPRCGNNSLKEVYSRVICPDCGYEKQF